LWRCRQIPKQEAELGARGVLKLVDENERVGDAQCAPQLWRSAYEQLCQAVQHNEVD
jgi:hypothetical protein